MNHSEFSVGTEFTCGDHRWRCTDVGARVVIAIEIDSHHDDPSWLKGPPFAIAEHVFDENDQKGCVL